MGVAYLGIFNFEVCVLLEDLIADNLDGHELLLQLVRELFLDHNLH